MYCNRQHVSISSIEVAGHICKTNPT